LEVNFDKLMTGADVQALRELLGIGSVDTYWLTGTGTANNKWKLQGEKSRVPISDPSLSILVRFLSQYPEYSFLPEFPDFYETFELASKTDPELFQNRIQKDKQAVNRFAVLFGKNSWNSTQWLNGATPSPVVERLFFIIVRLIEKEGLAGLKKYLDIVDQEAKARGFDSIDKLLRSGKWGKTDFDRVIKEEFS
jgi:hypothetical protein